MVIRLHRLFFIVFLILLFGNFLSGQTNTYVIGHLTEEITGDPVEGALIFIKSGEVAVESDESGFFQLIVEPDKKIILTIKRIGFEQINVNVNPIPTGQITKLDLTLKMDDVGEGVVITAEQIGDKNMVRANVEEFKLLPSVSGNIESLLPAIALGTSGGSGGELTSQYNVRGGNYDENLIYVNDFEIFRPQLIRIGQQEGLSFPNIDLIRDLAFSSGGFETRYGDRMASVLDIKYKRPEKFKGSVMGSALGASAHLEGSVKTGKKSFQKLRYLVGTRYKTTKYILGSLDTKGEYVPNFVDLQGLITWDFHPNLQLGLIGNYNVASYNFQPKSSEVVTGGFFYPLKFRADFEGGETDRFLNNMAGLSLSFVPTSKKNPAFIKFLTTVYNGDEKESFDILSYFQVTKLEIAGAGEKPKEVGVLGQGIQHTFARNRLENLIVNADLKAGIEFPRTNFEKGYESSHFIFGGLKVQKEDFRDRINEWTRTDSVGYSLPNSEDDYELGYVLKSANQIQSYRITGFLQETFTYNKHSSYELQTTIGSRIGYWTFNKEWIVSPRIQFLYRPLGRTNPITWKLAGGIYQQQPLYREMRRLDGTINNQIKSQKSAQVIGGLTYDFKTGRREPVKFRFITEAYYKSLWDLISYNVDNVRVRYSGENDSKGFVRGIDFRLNGEFVNGFESWANLSILQAREQLIGIQHIDLDKKEVEYVPRPSDQFLTFALYFQDYLPSNKNFRTNLQFTFGSGLPYGPPAGNIIQRNAARYKPYHRIDIGFSYKIWDEERKAQRPRSILRATRDAWISLEVFNLMDISNVASINWVKDFNNLYYYFPNNLTTRRINLKLRIDF